MDEKDSAHPAGDLYYPERVISCQYCGDPIIWRRIEGGWRPIDFLSGQRHDCAQFRSFCERHPLSEATLVEPEHGLFRLIQLDTIVAEVWEDLENKAARAAAAMARSRRQKPGEREPRRSLRFSD